EKIDFSLRTIPDRVLRGTFTADFLIIILSYNGSTKKSCPCHLFDVEKSKSDVFIYLRFLHKLYVAK
ncbi:30260_t:CDS:2, partial [Gigaspora margarita]